MDTAPFCMYIPSVAARDRTNLLIGKNYFLKSNTFYNLFAGKNTLNIECFRCISIEMSL